MEHLVKTLTSPDELAAEIEAGFAAQEAEEEGAAGKLFTPFHFLPMSDHRFRRPSWREREIYEESRPRKQAHLHTDLH